MADISQHILGGEVTSPKEFPWAVKIYACNQWFCNEYGGTIISESWVLTSAECVDGYSEFTVLAGANDVYVPNPERVVLRSNKVVKHPGYSSSNFDNNIALIELPSKLVFTDYIKPICLSAIGASVGDKASIMGWGDVTGSGSPSAKLQVKHRLTIIQNSIASGIYGSSIAISQNQICTSGSGICYVSAFFVCLSCYLHKKKCFKKSF